MVDGRQCRSRSMRRAHLQQGFPIVARSRFAKNGPDIRASYADLRRAQTWLHARAQVQVVKQATEREHAGECGIERVLQLGVVKVHSKYVGNSS